MDFAGTRYLIGSRKNRAILSLFFAAFKVWQNEDRKRCLFRSEPIGL